MLKNVLASNIKDIAIKEVVTLENNTFYETEIKELKKLAENPFAHCVFSALCWVYRCFSA